ncbi:DinB family protein [Fictibacillus sp. WQ 8-8]|uniref:DinB family protein n=1 Tax=Fictibacillus marinisediminis TaxID=2878389 RepID=A0A9X1X8F9_9BACL|nr:MULTISPECIES: DinB family protein [Fictibacillus]MCK6255406.1 DinB family protein [Fictibacillus marinisediminis]MCQ6268145.1 DinB family protein [Fictibacillus sp. WQ 8-8]
MNAKELLLNQLDAFQNNHWFVSLENSLVGLTDEQAAWKETQESNSIREIVNHLIYWNQRYLDRFTGASPSTAKAENDQTFEDMNGEWDWKKTVDRLKEVMAQWRNAIEESEEERFDEGAYEDRHEEWGSVIANLTIHTAYHTGQILYARKKQGSWNVENGVH